MELARHLARKACLLPIAENARQQIPGRSGKFGSHGLGVKGYAYDTFTPPSNQPIGIIFIRVNKRCRRPRVVLVPTKSYAKEADFRGSNRGRIRCRDD
jgi:hypothetical protein